MYLRNYNYKILKKPYIKDIKKIYFKKNKKMCYHFLVKKYF